MGMVVTLKEPIWAEAINFDAWHQDSHVIGVSVCDATGQWHRKTAHSVPGEWHAFSCELLRGWVGHWGGSGDGRMHLPIRAFELTLDRIAKGVKNPMEIGDAKVRNLSYVKMAETNACEAGGQVRYLVTDFRPGDVFSGGPRAFFRSDLEKRYEGGEMEIDFARNREVRLMSDIPIWGVPQEFRLTVEAPAESAGIELSVACNVGGSVAVHRCGRIRRAETGERKVCQSFVVPGFCGEGWTVSGGKKDLPKDPTVTKRLMLLFVDRGAAPEAALKVTPLRFEAVVSVGEMVPPLVAIPPKGGNAPRELEVGYLNLSGQDQDLCSVQVTVRDWAGAVISRVASRFSSTRSGDRSFAKVVLPQAADRLNFLSFQCDFFNRQQRDHRVGSWTTSWTRPLADAGPSGKNGGSPWGMCVCMSRGEDRFSFTSGYVSPTNERAIAEMETRAGYARKAGIRLERAEIKPSMVNTAKDRWDFSYYDRMLDIADRNGLACLGLCSHYFPRYDKPYSEACYSDYVKTVGLMARHFGDRIRAWEIWNEPDYGFWSGPKADYPRFVNMAWDELKGVSRLNRIVACSTAGVSLGFMDMCIGKGMKFDDLSFHPYRGNPVERMFLADLAAVTNRSHGSKTWLTEIGWPTGCDRDTYSEIEQAAYYARAYLTAAGSGMVHAIFGYDLVDDGFNVLARENNFGVLRRDLTPKPAYRGLAKVCRTFDEGVATLEPVAIGRTDDAWVFRMGGKSAVWAGRTAKLRVRTDGPSQATDLMDEPIGKMAEETTVAVGPLAVVFFDRNVLSVSEVEVTDERTRGFLTVF